MSPVKTHNALTAQQATEYSCPSHGSDKRNCNLKGAKSLKMCLRDQDSLISPKCLGFIESLIDNWPPSYDGKSITRHILFRSHQIAIDKINSPTLEDTSSRLLLKLCHPIRGDNEPQLITEESLLE